MRKALLKQRESLLPLLQEGLQIVIASLLLILSAQMSLLLPFSPIPISFQTFALFLIGLSLGPVKGFLAVLLYLMEGALGAPLFAHGFGGVAILLGPRGGYLLGFLAAVAIAGLGKNKPYGYWRLSALLLLANASIFFTGLAWLAFWVGFKQALALGFYPFIVGDLLKLAMAAACVKGYKLIHS